MPIEIRLLSRYQLRTKDNDPDALLLPAIELAPSKDSNVPHISSITISVRGTPEYLAKQIQSAYRVFSNSKPIKLSSEQRLKQSDCRLVQPFPTDFNCTLEVSIDYFDSDAAGNPNLSVPKNVKAECQLLPPSSEKTAPAPPPATEETTPPPAEKTAPVPPSATEETTPPPAEKTAPAPPSATEETTPPPVEKTAPAPPFATEETTPPPVEKTANDYPGWFAIDFGTSNSTVTLYDPKVVDPPKNLPQEQEVRLRLRLAEWVNQRPTDDLIHDSVQDWQSEWEKLLQEVSKNFQDPNPNNRDNLGDQIFLGTDSTRLLEAIRLIEISLNSCKDWFSRSASKQLNQIYYEVSRMPPLEWQGLIPVELDGTRNQQEIPSELKIEGLDDSFTTVTVLMGERARQDRKDALARSQDINEIQGKFYHSPKRYFGQKHSITVTLNGKDATIPVQNLIQAAYAHLIQLTDDYRKAHPHRCAVGNFYTGVVTYPTIAPPVVRREIEELVKKLGIKDVQTAYDEAVSVAIFYLLREFGGDLNIGIESFKTRCRRQGDKWSQNVLILDIGGGTTDIALIRLTLEEIDPFTSGEDRGYGGRYYKLTPKLLGSSGHLQLGGELITLRIFLLLKAAITDCILTEVSQGRLERDVLKIGLNELNQRFLKNDEFQSGTLLACVDKSNPEADASYKDALDDAEKVLSTRFQKSPSRLQTFYILWEHAERAKLILGQKPKTKDTTEPTFVLNGQQIAELLFEPNTLSPYQSLDNLSVELTVQQFEKAVTPVLKEAIGIAQGLMENCLKDDKQPVDWLILSGKTCNLDLVDKELYTKFSNSPSFVWNRERITFVPEYSKLATSIGACYAEKLRRLSFDPEQAKPLLRKGANQLYFDVKNLLYFLPCSFYREAIGSEYRIFEAGEKLSLVDPSESLVKIRSLWQGVQLNNIIQRQDFEGMTPQLWGSYNGKALAVELNMEEFEFLNKIKLQFEVDQKLEFSLLFCQGNPHYLIDAKIPSLNASDKIGTHPLISNENKVVCDIAICVAESALALNTDAHTIVFEAGKDYSKDLKVFCNEDGTMQQQLGLISDPLPPFPLSGKHSFYFQFRNSSANSWELIGELPQPEINTEYPCKYYVTLDGQGILRIHAGEVPYRKANTIEDLKQAGWVFRTELDLQPPEVEDKRNPFSGIH